MAERGAPPKVPTLQAKALRAVRALFSPLLPDDYLELINPLWSTRELRGRIERIERETADAATIVIRPGYEWHGHQPGQYLRIGVIVDGVHHWRAYSLTSDPGRADGCISITPKLVDEGKVSPYFVKQARPGEIVHLGGVEGTFVLPEPLPEKMLFISAGSGITPIMSMLRSLHRRDAVRDVVHLHSARTEDGVIFASQLQRLDQHHPGFRLHLQYTGESGRISPDDLDRLCEDWRDREAFISGPAEMLEAMIERWEADGERDKLHLERFQPIIGGDARRRPGRHDQVPEEQDRGQRRRRHPDPRRRRGRGRDPALRLPDGHLPHLRRAPVLGEGSRPADRGSLRPGRRDDPHLRERPRGRDRDRALNDKRRTC